MPPSTVHASLPLRPVYCFNKLGGTRRYGVSAGKPRRFAVGDAASRAQSSGEWPGVSSTFFRGFVGTALCVGGGASEKPDTPGGPRLGSGPRAGGGISPALRSGGWARGSADRGAESPPEARCAEFSAGKEGTVGEVVSESESESVDLLMVLGMWTLGTAGTCAAGVVRAGIAGFLKGGGGISFLSDSALAAAASRVPSRLICGVSTAMVGAEGVCNTCGAGVSLFTELGRVLVSLSGVPASLLGKWLFSSSAAGCICWRKSAIHVDGGWR